jgi:hypothetical protein
MLVTIVGAPTYLDSAVGVLEYGFRHDEALARNRRLGGGAGAQALQPNAPARMRFRTVEVGGGVVNLCPGLHGDGSCVRSQIVWDQR